MTGCGASTKKKPVLKAEAVYRLKEEAFLVIPPSIAVSRPVYPWHKRHAGPYPLISKEFFHCCGTTHNLPYSLKNGSGIVSDCTGRHGLPVRDEREFIYPCLISILNHIQSQTQKRVVITCGHRCPWHNRYADPASYNWNSKHMLGAEVDFYVEGMEEQVEKILTIIFDYYKTTSPFAHNPEYTQFERYKKGGLNVSTPPWMNRELFIKLYKKDEGRDLDNQHPYPYLSLQVRYDRQGERVRFSESAAQNYLHG